MQSKPDPIIEIQRLLSMIQIGYILTLIWTFSGFSSQRLTIGTPSSSWWAFSSQDLSVGLTYLSIYCQWHLHLHLHLHWEQLKYLYRFEYIIFDLSRIVSISRWWYLEKMNEFELNNWLMLMLMLMILISIRISIAVLIVVSRLSAAHIRVAFHWLKSHWTPKSYAMLCFVSDQNHRQPIPLLIVIFSSLGDSFCVDKKYLIASSKSSHLCLSDRDRDVCVTFENQSKISRKPTPDPISEKDTFRRYLTMAVIHLAEISSVLGILSR
jgi:hypothetical protein